MAIQIEKVFAKHESDADFTEIENVYNGDELIFQKAPTGSNYSRIILTATPSALAPEIWNIYNSSQYTINIGWSNGVVSQLPPDAMGQFPVGIIPIWIQVTKVTGYVDGSFPAASTGALDQYHYFADCVVSYNYLRNLYVDD